MPMDSVLAALSQLRVGFQPMEQNLHRAVEGALHAAGIEYCHEARAGRCRLDFLTADGIAIEVKRGRPLPSVAGQLARYAALPQVTGVVLVAPRAYPLPKTLAGKPCAVVALQKLWGVSVS